MENFFSILLCVYQILYNDEVLSLKTRKKCISKTQKRYCQLKIRSQSAVIGELVLLEGGKEGDLVLGPLHGDSVKDYSSPEASSQTSDMTKKKKKVMQ